MNVIDIVHASSVAAVATDDADRVLACTRAAERLLGHAAESIVGSDWGEAIETRDVFGNRLPMTAVVHETVRAGEPIRAFEIDARKRLGGLMRVLVSVLVAHGPEPFRYRLLYHLSPRRRRSRAEEAIELLLKEPARSGLPASASDLGRRSHDEPRLTRREREVLRRLARGQDTSQIADSLHISVSTVRSHSQRILRKLGAHSRAEAVSAAFQRGLV